MIEMPQATISDTYRRIQLLPADTPHPCPGSHHIEWHYEDLAKFKCPDCNEIICTNCLANHNDT